ncbi:hypothetical protein V1503_19970 [Bacillus sp. SCS-151]|uniref:hypothetical protein n=1 Tax=Nanhaiella sioensis TaxID=3115293 RepID=UPI00397E4547
MKKVLLMLVFPLLTVGCNNTLSSTKEVITIAIIGEIPTNGGEGQHSTTFITYEEDIKSEFDAVWITDETKLTNKQFDSLISLIMKEKEVYFINSLPSESTIKNLGHNDNLEEGHNQHEIMYFWFDQEIHLGYVILDEDITETRKFEILLDIAREKKD